MQLSDANVLVTGGAGFIGSELTRQLLPQCARVVVLDNLANGRRENVPDAAGGKLDLVVADIRDRGRVAELLHGIDIVFHLACLGVRHSIHSPRENHEVNATATLDLLSAARDAGVRRFVYTSSSEVYGTAKWAPMTEDHPAFPMTVYGASKLAGECYVRAFHRTYDYPAVVVRPFNAYGPRCHHEGDSGEVIPKFMLRCLAGLPMVVFGDGSQTRDFTFVTDTARGIAAAATCDAAIGQTINLGSSVEITIRDLAGAVAHAAGLDGANVIHDAPRPGDVLRLYADCSRARELLGFKPSIGFSEGLAKLRDWYLATGRSPLELLENECVRNWEVAAH
jgi:UDP-glucose 4-epimerase